MRCHIIFFHVFLSKVRKARNRRQEWNVLAYDKEFRPDARLTPSPYHGTSPEGSLSPDSRYVAHMPARMSFYAPPPVTDVPPRQVRGLRLVPRQSQPPLDPGLRHRSPQQGSLGGGRPDPVAGSGAQAGQPANRRGGGGDHVFLPMDDN